jgi:hypothetical protein
MLLTHDSKIRSMRGVPCITRRVTVGVTVTFVFIEIVRLDNSNLIIPHGTLPSTRMGSYLSSITNLLLYYHYRKVHCSQILYVEVGNVDKYHSDNRRCILLCYYLHRGQHSNYNLYPFVVPSASCYTLDVNGYQHMTATNSCHRNHYTIYHHWTLCRLEPIKYGTTRQFLPLLHLLQFGCTIYGVVLVENHL